MSKRVDPDKALMDCVHDWTHFDKLRKAKLPIGRGARAVQLHHRDLIKRAHRFTLDDGAVRLICHLSRGERREAGDVLTGRWAADDRLPGWSFLARLPFDTCWFEYDCRTKLDEWDAMGTLHQKTDYDDPDFPSPLKIGYLMYKDGDNERWICHVFTSYPTGAVLPAMVSFVFDPEGDARFPVRGSAAWKVKTLSELDYDFGFDQRGPVDPSTGKLTRHHIDPELIVGGVCADGDGYEMPDWLSPRLAVIIDPWWAALREDNAARYDLGPFNERVRHDVREHASHVRWIITMLASVNGLPRNVRLVEARPGRRSVGMNLLPYFEHHHIEIDLPTENRTLKARQLLDREARNSQRRWHMVIGHWRVVELGKRTFMCRHSPVMVEKGLGLCERCGLLVRWIPAHGRGDATLGVIDHDYGVSGDVRS